MAPFRRAPPGGQELEAVIEALGDLGGRQVAHARGGELEGQRNAVELLADPAHGGEVLRTEPEAGAHGGGAVDEQLDGVRVERRVGGGPFLRDGQAVTLLESPPTR